MLQARVGISTALQAAAEIGVQQRLYKTILAAPGAHVDVGATSRYFGTSQEAERCVGQQAQGRIQLGRWSRVLPPERCR